MLSGSARAREMVPEKDIMSTVTAARAAPKLRRVPFNRSISVLACCLHVSFIFTTASILLWPAVALRSAGVTALQAMVNHAWKARGNDDLPAFPVTGYVQRCLHAAAAFCVSFSLEAAAGQLLMEHSVSVPVHLSNVTVRA